ncbi:MAG: ATP-binding cassette domain-containing protein [Candidatus Aminicenantes bacterium]|nr:ATP-binding cassette domain-containing protein [Candidatus Aminicenantes bacterium]
MKPALEIKNLCKQYHDFEMKGINLTLPSGYIMGLIGPNGAGKTTLIKLILGIIPRKSGEIKVFGMDNSAHETEIKSRIGFVHEEPCYHNYLKVKEASSLFSRFYPDWDQGHFQTHCEDFNIPLNKRISALSRGTKMKLSLALALSHDADFLLMDEPTTGLDPVFRRELLKMFSGVIQNQNKAVLFSTHISSDLERTADYITYLQNGNIFFSGTKDHLFETWALVKGGTDILDHRAQKLFKGIRKSRYGFKALISDKEKVQLVLSGKNYVMEKPSLDDLMFLLSKGKINA